MTTDANDVAVCKLLFEATDGSSATHHVGEISALHSHVIELENHDVRLAAIRTVMSSQVVVDEPARLLPTTLTRQAGLIAVQLTS